MNSGVEMVVEQQDGPCEESMAFVNPAVYER